eukprot:1422712-Rhodomonas_salina.3
MSLALLNAERLRLDEGDPVVSRDLHCHRIHEALVQRRSACPLRLHLDCKSTLRTEVKTRDAMWERGCGQDLSLYHG